MDIGGWETHPKCRKMLLQGHVALKTLELAANARVASTENIFQTTKAINSVKNEKAAECFHGAVRHKQVFFNDTNTYIYT